MTSSNILKGPYRLGRDDDKIDDIQSGVYAICKDDQVHTSNNTLYVGQSNDLLRRLKEHKSNELWSGYETFYSIWIWSIDSEEDRIRAEKKLINDFNPPLNDTQS